MCNDTKEIISEAALTIFARDVYAGTNIKDIAESLGLVSINLLNQLLKIPMKNIAPSVLCLYVRYCNNSILIGLSIFDIIGRE